MTTSLHQPKTLQALLNGMEHSEIRGLLSINDLQTDSRLITSGTAFISFNPNTPEYVKDAAERGAVSIVVDAEQSESVQSLEVPLVKVKQLKQNLPVILDRFFEKPSEDLSLVGVTGTNGKSTIVSLVAQLASLLGDNSATIGTLGYGFHGSEKINTGLTTPGIVECYRILRSLKEENADIVAMEVSSHGIHQGRVDGLKFVVNILSNITHDHLDYHGNFEAYRDVKRSFFMNGACECAVLNIDDFEGRNLAEDMKSARPEVRVITYSLGDPTATLSLKNIERKISGTSAILISPWGEKNIEIPLLGDFNLSNILAAIGANLALGKDFSDLAVAVASIKSVEGRLQKVELDEPGSSDLPAVYVDYAHTPDALKNVLQSLRAHCSHSLWLVFGCGGDRDKSKRSIMGKIAEQEADFIIVTSDNPRNEDPASILNDIAKGISKTSSVDYVLDRQLAISKAIETSKSHDLVLIAGKGHENYQISGSEVIDFSDYDIAKTCLQARAQAQVGK